MPDLPAAADTRCPRCGGAFRCGADDPGPCACTTLRLAPSTLARLADRYRGQGCLCLRCLADLAAAAAPEESKTAGTVARPAGR